MTAPQNINILCKGTKAEIEAFPGLPEGSIAYATDTNELGTYNGTSWAWGGSGSGDMLKSVYDTDNDGIVDNSEKWSGYDIEIDTYNDGAVPAWNTLDGIFKQALKVRFTGAAPAVGDVAEFAAIDGQSISSSGKKGVTNGDSHDHSGGDGGQIAYSSLSGKPTAESNTADIFQVGASPGGTSAFVGTINGAPSGASVAYNVTSGTEGAMKPAATNQLAKMRLYNTTRGDYALISDCDTGTNTITLTANAPGTWQNGDTITIQSQTLTTALTGLSNWVDLEITSGPTGKSSLFIKMQVAGPTATTGNDELRIHPFTSSFSSSKFVNCFAQVANRTMNDFGLIEVVNNVFCISWNGTPTNIIIREAGYLQ